MLFDPAGKNIVTIADGITRIDLSTYAAGEVFVLYEQGHKLFQASYDPHSLTKLREIEIDVPKLSLPKLKG